MEFKERRCEHRQREIIAREVGKTLRRKINYVISYKGSKHGLFELRTGFWVLNMIQYQPMDSEVKVHRLKDVELAKDFIRALSKWGQAPDEVTIVKCWEVPHL